MKTNIKRSYMDTSEMPYANRKIYELVQNETNGNVSAFAQKIKVTQQSLNRIFCIDKRNGKFPSVSNDIKQAIIETYGKDEIWFISDLGSNENSSSEEGNNIQSNQITPQINYTSGVPYYNVDFIGGFDIVLNDQTAKPEYLIDFKKYNEATCWCNVTGHSMEPEITHGDIIALKKIEDMSFLPLGEVYAIVTTNGMRTIKRLGPSNNTKCYTLVPTNKSPEYGIQELPKDMIKHIFQVLGCMKRL